MRTRREFIRDCVAGAAVVALAPVTTLAKPAPSEFLRTGMPGFEEFRQQLNSRFTVKTAAMPLDLTLVQAIACPAHPTHSEVAANESFSLIFRGPENLPLSQDTYEFAHPQLGPLSIFIVPIGQPTDRHCRYEAVFSRPASAAEFALQLSRAPKRMLNA